MANASIYGFILESKAYVEEIKAEGHIYRHEQTGARLLHIPCEDNNKVFAVLFATPPQDDSGVAHILEHSIMGGSEKYPLREPFVTLLKGSMSTFLNAVTLPDTTMFPFASQNEKDFFNLLDVYLDAVFHPMIYHEPLIFRQEGWHYEIDEEGKVFYNGIVLNEMKGVMSDPDEIIAEAARKLLLDNVYQFNSGGNPQAITDLSQEQFLDFHRTFYRPSNALFYLYGNADLEKVLAKLDGDYLAAFDKGLKAAPVPPATPLDRPQYLKMGYPAQDGFGFAGTDFVLGPASDMLSNMAAQVITTALFDLESSPVRRRLIESGACRNVMASATDNVSNGFLSVLLINTGIEEPQEVEACLLSFIREALAPVLEPERHSDRIGREARAKIDQLFEAALNSLAFALKEGDTGSMPKGLVYAFQSLPAWANGEDPLNRLRYNEHLEALKGELASGALYRRIRPLILDNQHRATVVLVPDAEAEKRLAMAEAQKVEARWNALSEEAQAAELTANEALLLRQSTPDAPDIIALLPKVGLEDLERKNHFRDVACETVPYGEKDTFRLLHYDIFTSGISYVTLHFPLSNIAAEDLFPLSILSDCLGQMNTKRHNYMDLTNRILAQTGGIGSNLSFYPDERYLNVGVHVMNDQIQHGFSLLQEILLTTQFDDTDRLENLLMMTLSRMQMGLIGSGHRYAIGRVGSRFNREVKAEDLTSGIEYYGMLYHLLGTYEEQKQNLAAHLQELLKQIVNRQGLTVSLIGDAESKALWLDALKKGLVEFPDFTTRKIPFELDLAGRNEAFLIPSQVHYVAQGGNLKKVLPQYEFNGCDYVLQALLNKDFLWNELRIKGGAYDVGTSMSRNGNLIFNSHRDPNCKATLDVFSRIPDYLKTLELSHEELENYIIGTVAGFDMPMSPFTEGSNAIGRFFRGISLEQLQKEREQAMSVTVSDLRKMADPIRELLQQNAFCVLGGEEGIRPDEAIFEDIRPLL